MKTSGNGGKKSKRARNITEQFLDTQEIDISEFENIETYCMGGECKKGTRSKDFIIHVEETSKGERWRLGMNCVNCNANKSTFIKKEKISENIIGNKIKNS